MNDYVFKLGADTDGAVKMFAVYEDGSKKLVDGDNEELWRDWCNLQILMTGEVGSMVDITFMHTKRPANGD